MVSGPLRIDNTKVGRIIVRIKANYKPFIYSKWMVIFVKPFVEAGFEKQF
jgi:hypothetical protein